MDAALADYEKVMVTADRMSQPPCWCCQKDGMSSDNAAWDCPACYIKGGPGVRLVLEHLLGIGVGENTPDNRLGLHLGQCNGTCDHAPQVWVDGKVVGPLTAAATVELVRDLQRQKGIAG